MIDQNIKIEDIKKFSEVNMIKHIGIEFTTIGKDFVEAKMPVDERTTQPFGLLHGGASVTLAESLGGLAASLSIDLKKKIAVGLEINSNHIKSMKTGYVYGRAKAIHIGRSNHIWEIRIRNEEGTLVNISKITMAIIDKKS
jgi:1,4-dihydroxy-2-naphthoyl-CoA hydrolase